MSFGMYLASIITAGVAAIGSWSILFFDIGILHFQP